MAKTHADAEKQTALYNAMKGVWRCCFHCGGMHVARSCNVHSTDTQRKNWANGGAQAKFKAFLQEQLEGARAEAGGAVADEDDQNDAASLCSVCRPDRPSHCP